MLSIHNIRIKIAIRQDGILIYDVLILIEKVCIVGRTICGILNIFFLCLLTFSFSNDNSIWPKMLQNKKCNRDDEKYDANTNNSIAKSERKLARFTNYKNDKE